MLYDFVELFDFTDGRLGTSIDRNDLTLDNEWDIKFFFGNRDPRFRASVFYPETDFKSTKGLVFKYNLDTGRYVITLKNAEGRDRSFGPERYYLPFDNQDVLADNPNLRQNSRY